MHVAWSIEQGMVTLSRDADALLDPFYEGEKWQPQVHTVTLSLRYLNMYPHNQVSQDSFI